MHIVQRSFDERFVICRGIFFRSFRGSDGYWWSHIPENAESFKSLDAAIAKLEQLKLPPEPTISDSNYKIVYPTWMAKLIFWN